MQIINYAHPLTPEQIAQLESLLNSTDLQITHLSAKLAVDQPFAPQITTLLDQAELSAEQWQTESLLIILPALNFAAATMLAELHGRCGYFPAIIRLRPVKDAVPPRFEVAEIINLNEIRQQARDRRG